TFQILSKNKVYTDLFEETGEKDVSHIHMADWADISVVARATANIMAKMAVGLADDFVSTSLMASSSPIVVVPAMNTNMWHNEATQTNKETLEKRGIHVVEPDKGFLAEGYEGDGRFPVNERILEEVAFFLGNYQKSGYLQNQRVLITAGGTKERLDPVRYITNDSSGKMGHSLAKAARNEGAEVTLITASHLPAPSTVKAVHVESAEEMEEAVLSQFFSTDIVIMAAAVSDYRPKLSSNQKIKKKTETMQLELIKTPDILKELGTRKANQLLIGFAAETQNVKEYALKKLQDKNLNIIVANDVSKSDAGFN